MAKSFVNFSRKTLALALRLVVGDILPQRRSLAVDPPLQPLPGEGNTLALVLLTSAQRGTQNTFDQHLLLHPLVDVVVVIGAGQPSVQALGP